MTLPIIPGNDPVQQWRQPGPPMPPIPIVPSPKKGLSQGAIGGITVGVLTVGLLGLLALGKILPDPAAPAPATSEARVEKCAVTSSGYMYASVAMTNSTSTAHSYFVTVAFVVGSQRVAEGHVSTSTLRPGESAREDADSFTEGSPPFRCEIVKVTRT